MQPGEEREYKLFDFDMRLPGGIVNNRDLQELLQTCGLYGDAKELADNSSDIKQTLFNKLQAFMQKACHFSLVNMFVLNLSYYQLHSGIAFRLFTCVYHRLVSVPRNNPWV